MGMGMGMGMEMGMVYLDNVYSFGVSHMFRFFQHFLPLHLIIVMVVVQLALSLHQKTAFQCFFSFNLLVIEKRYGDGEWDKDGGGDGDGSHLFDSV